MAPEPDGSSSGGRRYRDTWYEDGSQYHEDGSQYHEDGSQYHEDGPQYHSDRDLQLDDLHLPTPNGAFAIPNRSPASPSGSAHGRDREREGQEKKDGEQNRSRTRTGRNGSGQLRICKKCGEALTGQFVRALGGPFIWIASCVGIAVKQSLRSFFQSTKKMAQATNIHFARLTISDVFGAQDSYYEHEGQVYCHYHYSTQFAQRCNGCQTAILKQFVEIFRNGQNQHWHPECYMIHKFWNVRLTTSQESQEVPRALMEAEDEEGRNFVRLQEERMEGKVFRIWSVLSTFEESSAACISDMLLHVSNGAYVDGVLVAKKFIWHVDILFRSADKLVNNMMRQGTKPLSYAREAKLLCKKIVAFFSLLSKTQETGVRKLGVTQELLALVTGLAHYLKLLIRICLQGALRVEKEQNDPIALHEFLDDLGDMDALKNNAHSLQAAIGTVGLASQNSDQCFACLKPVEDECARSRDRRWHLSCLQCTACLRDLGHNLEDVMLNEQQGRIFCINCVGRSSPDVAPFEHISKLQQYVFLLRVALARLLEKLRTSGSLPHTSDDPNLNGYNSQEGHRLAGENDPPLLRSDTRSKSYGGPVEHEIRDNSYENTLNDVRRLRSQRLDQRLSSTIKKARTSRIMDGPEGSSVRPGSAGADGSDARKGGFQIVEDRDNNGDSRTELMFGHQDALTLDDIPRIVAAEQAKEQRPNAYKHARHDMFRTSITEPKLVNGHQRHFSNGDQLAEPSHRREAGKRYFSELTALEYFIVRHVAVLTMQPMLEGHFTLEELLNLIETRKPTFWNKMGKAFKPDNRKSSKKKGVFGVPLDIIVDRDGADSTDGIGPGALRIPAIVDDSITTMRKMDLSVEGVFRKNGNIKRLNDTSMLIDKEGCDAVDWTKENVVQVAALLKKYLRELPDALLTFKLHRLFIASQKIADGDKRRRILHLTCCLLPKVHRDCLEILCSFFNWVASFHQVDEESGSKMDTHNLATVIAPNILFTNAKSPVDDNFLAIEVVHTLIECNEQMCEVPEDLQSILSDPTLFGDSSDITTKEILKRYGDIAASGGPKHQVETTDSPNRAKESRAIAPTVTRVDADASQFNAWQKESSVRHVQDSAIAYGNQNTPPTQHEWQGQELERPSYGRRNGNGTPESERTRREHRNSGWGRSSSTVGVAGTI